MGLVAPTVDGDCFSPWGEVAVEVEKKRAFVVWHLLLWAAVETVRGNSSRDLEEAGSGGGGRREGPQVPGVSVALCSPGSPAGPALNLVYSASVSLAMRDCALTQQDCGWDAGPGTWPSAQPAEVLAKIIKSAVARDRCLAWQPSERAHL